MGQIPHLLQVLRVEGSRASFPYPCWHMADHSARTSSLMTLRIGSGRVYCTAQVGDLVSPLLSASVGESQYQFSAVLSVRSGATSVQPLSFWPLPISRTWDINTDCDCFRSMNLSMGCLSSPGQDMTMTRTCNQANHFCQLFSSFVS